MYLVWWPCRLGAQVFLEDQPTCRAPGISVAEPEGEGFDRCSEQCGWLRHTPAKDTDPVNLNL